MATSNYSTRSLDRLKQAHPELEQLFMLVGSRFPNTILETKRSLEQQKANVKKGVSKTMDSRHLDEPHANAVDAAPDPLEWPSVVACKKRIAELVDDASPRDVDVHELLASIEEYAMDLARWYYFGGYVLGVADERGLEIRWGGDWNGNRSLEDQTFHDLPHFERKRRE